jgi:hypothetical protein
MLVKHALPTAIAAALWLCPVPAHAADHIVLAARRDGAMPSSRIDDDRLFVSEGGALFLEAKLQATMQARSTAPRGIAEPRWWMRIGDSPGLPSLPPDIPPRPLASPWQAPLSGDAAVRRSRPGRVDHPQRMTANVPVEFALADTEMDAAATDLVVEVMRDTAVLPQAARRRTALEIQADDITVFSGMPALPSAARRPYRVGGKAHLLEQVAELRIAVPAGTHRLRVRGEPGAYVRVLTALTGSPAQVRDAAQADVGFAARDDETPDDTYRRALSALPAAAARAHVLRHGFFAPAALSASGDANSAHRIAQLRPVQAEDETAAWYGDAAELDTQMPAPTALTWLAPGSTLTLPQDPGPETPLYRMTVVHPEGDDARRIELTIHDDQDDASALAFDPAFATRLSGHRTAEDGLLARQQEDHPAIPVVDASRAHLLLPEGRRIVRIDNLDRDRGLWIAIERHRPAPAAIMQVPGTPGLNALADALKRDLLGEAATDGASVADDRSAAAAARLIAARRATFEADRCASVEPPPTPSEADAALALTERLGDEDPVLMRCALVRSVATTEAPSPRALSAFRAWTDQQQRPDLLTGLQASHAVRTQTADDWHALAEALRAEVEPAAAEWVDRIAALAVGDHHAETDPRAVVIPEEGPDAGEQLPPDQSAGARWLSLSSRLRPALRWAATPDAPLSWSLPQAGDHVLELRARGGHGIVWVRLDSGTQTRWLALLSAQTDETDETGAAETGPMIRVALRGGAPGAHLRLSPLDGDILADLSRTPNVMNAANAGADSITTSTVTDATIVDDREAELRQVDAGDTRHRTLRLKTSRLSAPSSISAVPSTVEGLLPADDLSPLLTPADGTLPTHASYPQDPGQAVLEALWLLRVGSDDAVAAAGWALRTTSATLSPDLQRLRNRLRAQFRWQPYEQIAASGGQWLRPLADGQLRTPEFVARSALGGELPADAIVLTPGREWQIDGFAPNQRVRLGMRLHTALPGAALPVSVGKQRFVFRSGQPRRLDFRADASGTLALTLGETLPATYLRVDVPEGAGLRSLDSEPYHLSLPGAPLRIHSERPALLLVTEWDGSRDATSLQWVQAGETELAAQQLPNAALRFDALTAVPNATAAPPTHLGAAAGAQPTSQATAQVLRSATVSALTPGIGHWPDDVWPHTPGAYAGVFQRRDPDDAATDGEHFVEIGARWRTRSEDARWRGRLDVFSRHHSRGFDVLGAEALLEWRPQESPWQIVLAAQSLYQPDDRVDGQRPASLQLRAEAAYDVVYDDRWESTFEAGAIAQTTSINNVSRADAARLDSELQSTYRSDHPFQPYFGYRLRWRADWRDTLSADLRLTGNAPGDRPLDNARLALDWYRVGPRWVHNASLDWRRAFVDDNRSHSFNRVRIGGATSRYALGPVHGWRLRLEAAYDLRDRAPVASVQFEWFRHNGRGIADLLASEAPLRGVLEHDLHTPLRGETTQ